MATDERPLPHFVLRTANTIAPDALLEKFRALRTHRLACWTSLLSYYVLAPVLIEHVTRLLEQTAQTGSGAKKSEQLEEIASFVAASETMLEACATLRSGSTKLQATAEKAVVAQAKILAPIFAAWDQDLEHVALWIADLETIYIGRKPTVIVEAIRKTKTFFKRGSGVLKRTIVSAATAYKRYHRLHNEIVVANLKLVANSTKRYVYRVTSVEDLGSEGVIGLMKAVHRFDPDRGFCFSTYAVHWIRHYVVRRQQSDDLIRLPVHLQEKFNRINRTRERLRVELGVEPNMKELIDAANADIRSKTKKKNLRVDEAAVLMLDRRPTSLLSMHHPIGLSRDDPATLQDVLPDRSASAESQCEHAQLREIVEHMLAQMPAAKADAFRQIAGLSDGDTLASVGERHHLSRERIRQLSIEAADQIRRTIRRRRIHFTFGKGGGVGVGTGGGRDVGGP